MADCVQFLSENRLNGCQIFGLFGYLETESEQNFGFPRVPSLRPAGIDPRDHWGGGCVLTTHNKLL